MFSFCLFGVKPSYYSITLMLQKFILFLGFDTKTFKGNTLRIGGATHLNLSGLSEDYINIKGRCKSMHFRLSFNFSQTQSHLTTPFYCF